MVKRHQQGDHSIFGRQDPNLTDLDAGHGTYLTDSQLEHHTAPQTEYAPPPTKTNMGAREKGDTVIRGYRVRQELMLHLTKANDPDALPMGINGPDAAIGAAVGGVAAATTFGALLGPGGAALGAAVGGIEFKFRDNYYTLASLPGHVLTYLEENTDIPFSEGPGVIKKWAWDVSEHVFPDFTRMMSFVMAILLDNFEDPEFTKVVPSQHWWQEDGERKLERHEIVGSALDRAGERTIRQLDKESKAQFYDAVDHLGKQLGGDPGVTEGLVAFQSPLDNKAQQIELATIGHIVGDMLDDYRGRVSSDGRVQGFRMKIRDEEGKIRTVTRDDLDITNRDDLVIMVRSRFIGTKYERLKTSAERADTMAPGPVHDPHAEEVEAEERKGTSALITGLFAAAGISPEQFLDMIGGPKGPDGAPLQRIEKNTEIEPGKTHLMVVRTSPEGVEYRTPLFEELDSKELELTAHKLNAVKNLHELAPDPEKAKELRAEAEALRAAGKEKEAKEKERMAELREHDRRPSQQELLHGIDTSGTEFEGFTVHKDKPDIQLDTETMILTANFSRTKEAEEGHDPEIEHKRLRFDLTQSGVKKIEEKAMSRDELTKLESDLGHEENPTILGAMMSALSFHVASFNPKVEVSEDVLKGGNHELYAQTPENTTPHRLDTELSPEELKTAREFVETVAAGAHAAETKPAGGGSAPETATEREGGSSSGDEAKSGKLDPDQWARTQAFLDALEKGEAMPDVPAPEDASSHGIKPGKTPGGDKGPGGWEIN